MPEQAASPVDIKHAAANTCCILNAGLQRLKPDLLFCVYVMTHRACHRQALGMS